MRCPSALEIQSYVDREMDLDRAAEVGEHLAHCPVCQDQARGLAATATLLQTLAEVPPAAAGVAFVQAGRPKARKGWTRFRWVAIPAAACLIVGIAFTARHFLTPPTDSAAFFAAFVEAHNTPVEAESIEPCDFGLGGS